MKFNKRHKDALKFYAESPEKDMYTPYGIGEGTMSVLEQNGYVTRHRQWIGYSYQITEKGMRVVGQWVPDDVQKRLDKWNKSAKRGRD